VFRILPMASGKPSTPTIRGSFRVYSKTPGTNALGMVNSVYFYGGYAIHGYHDVPPYAASHGCLRIPIPNSRFVHRWLDYKDRVDVYR
jgi:lipoprotein-anchoring transpeptidase ErfK/SrfK